MAFDIKDEAPVDASDRTLITGMANLAVVALNPTKAEQEEMGRKPKEEPQYFGPSYDKTSTQIQLDFYLAGQVIPDGETLPVEVLVKHTIWVEDSTSRGLSIDKFGKFGKDASRLDASARACYNGEADLVQFFKALCNLGQKDVAALDNASKMVKTGDLSEIKAILNDAHKRGRKVRCLLGVKDGKYQDVFSGQFEYEGEGGSAYLNKRLIAESVRLRDRGKAMSYFGPINTLNEMYSPSAYVARRYSAEAQEQFEQTLPRGTAGTGPGGVAAGAFSTVATGPNQPFNAANEPFPQQRFATPLKPQPEFAPIGDDDMPF